MRFPSFVRQIAQYPRRIPLRFLAIPFVLQTIGTVALVGYFCYQGGRKSVANLSYQLIDEISNHVYYSVTRYLETPAQLNQLNATALRLGQLEWQDFSTLEPYFVQQLQAIPDVSGIAIATEQQEFLSVAKSDEQSFLIRRRDRSTNQRFNHHLVNADGQRLRLRESQDNFDPDRDFPQDSWYEETKMTERSSWQLLVSSVQGEERPILMAAHFAPFYDSSDRFQGIVSAAVYLTEVGRFLESLTVGRSGQTFILDQEGLLIATSTGEVPFTPETMAPAQSLDRAQHRLSSPNSQNPITRHASQVVTPHFSRLNQIQQPQQLSFNLDKQRYFAQVTPLPIDPELNWFIVTVIPESDFTEQMQHNVQLTMLASILTLVLSAGLGAISTRLLTRSLDQLNTAAKRIAEGDFSTRVQIDRFEELSQLAQSFDVMALHLLGAFSGLRTLNQALIENESHLKQILGSLPVGVSLHRVDGSLAYLNQRGHYLLGISAILECPVETMAATYHIYRAGTDHLYPAAELPAIRALKGESITIDDLEIRQPDQVRLLEVRSIPILDTQGDVIYSLNTFQDITLRRQTEAVMTDYHRELEHQIAERTQALQRSEATNNALIQAIPDLLVRMHRDGTYLDIRLNGNVRLLMPLDIQKGANIYDVLPNDFSDERMHYVQKALDTQTIQTYEYEVTVENTQHYEEARIVPYADDEVLLIVRDISDRKYAELALRRERAFLQQVIDAIPSAVYVKDKQERFLILNQAAAAIYGLPVDEMVGKRDTEVNPNTDLIETFIANSRQVMTDLQPLTFSDQYLVNSQGEGRWYQPTLSPLLDDHEQVQGIIGNLVDITPRKCAEAALRQSEERFQEIAATISQLFIMRSATSGEYLYISPAYEKIWGRSCESLYQNPNSWLESIHPDDRPLVLETLNEQFQGQPVIREYRIMRPDGSIRWIRAQINLICDPAGQPLRFIGVAEDITDRKQVEAKLNAQQQFLRHIIDAVPSSIFVKDRDGRYLVVNEAGAAIYGVSVEEMVDKFDRELNPDAAQVEEFLAVNWQVMDTLQPQIDPAQAILNAQGETRWFKTVISPFFDSQGQVQGIIGSSTDITDLKQTEEELRVAKEAAEAANRAKSAFLATMSHELRTPLNAILGFAQLMSTDAQMTPLQQEHLSIINRNGEHLLQLINDVLSISKIEAGRITVEETCCDLFGLMDDLITTFRWRAAAKGLQLRCDRSPDVPQYISMDERKLRQVLTNLMDNAVKFTPTGHITWRIYCANADERFPTSPAVLIIDLEDTGVGIAPDELNSIFEAFTQSESGRRSAQGSGLGLTISRHFVQLMGGQISVRSQVGQGTAFCIRLPLKPIGGALPVSPTAQRVVGLAPHQPTYRILVADDIETNRCLIMSWLTAVGFEVRGASNGQEAIEQWLSFAPHLIWMDMRMPILGGMEAVAQIRSTEQEMRQRGHLAENDRPLPTKIIGVTAAIFDQERQQMVAVGCDDFVSKPCSAAVILDKLADQLQVHYLYETVPTVSLKPSSTAAALPPAALYPDTPDILSALQTLSPDWLAQFNYAARRANERDMFQLLDDLPPSQTALKEAVIDLINTFQLERLIHLTRSLMD